MTTSELTPKSATLYCVTPPDDSQYEKILDFLKGRYGEDVTLSVVVDKSLGQGFRLEIGCDIYDWSREGRLDQLKETLLEAAGHSGSVIPLIKSAISDFHLHAEEHETGRVITVGDGIATVSGLDGAQYGEIVVFESGVRAMVQDLRCDCVGCILFGSDDDVVAGTLVTRTKKTAGVPVGEAFLGRIVNALGAPIDGEGDIESETYLPVESPAPGIVDRQSVNTPMETGILTIDSMFPIGRGQRELIIGDRQTGKTAIAIDTIINQRGKDVICVYVAIGQKASSVAQVAESLRRRGAMDYTVIVNASASESAPMQYIAPYAGTAIAEYFMHRGKDVLIVYDDLSKHAIAYRALSLLLDRSPGREAYPGDVFYLHSRLLERSAHLSDALGGGSITALPIVETQAGDVSAYIPTNIISITDGQIFLESELFRAGQRPAVNVGISVSRVGGAAQTKAMKSAAGTIRLDLAQYREMEVFTQFSSDLDEATMNQLLYGQGLMYLLRQPQHRSMKLHEQVLTLVCAMDKIMLGINVKNLKKFQEALLNHFEMNYADICREINTGAAISADLRERITKAARDFRDKEATLL